jgi:hypothetical protein
MSERDELRMLRTQLDRLADDVEDRVNELLRSDPLIYRREIRDLDAIIRCVRGLARGHGDPLSSYQTPEA